MDKLLDTSELRDPLRERLRSGLPAFATCAGLIVLAREVVDGRPDQSPLGVIDATVRRNGYGRQRESFEADLTVRDLAGGSFRGVFIRSPKIERVGPGVDVLAEHEGVPVFGRQDHVFFATFHPELSGDLRLHEMFLREVQLMSGHSKWHSIKHKKGAADKARGKLFAVLIRQIEVAARAGGGDPESNATLRTMVGKARDNSVPIDTIQRAIRRGTGEEEGVTYEADRRTRDTHPAGSP